MMTRRDAFAAMAGGTAFAAAGGAAGRTVETDALPALDHLRAAPLMNLERAARVLAEEGLAGLVLAQPASFFTIANSWPATNRMGFGPTCFALVPAEPERGLAIVVPDFTWYYLLADRPRAYDLAVFLHSGAQDGGSYPVTVPEPASRPAAIFPDAGEAPLRPREAARREAVARVTSQRPPSAGLGFALKKALAELGMTSGRLGIDVAGLAPLLADIAPDASPVDGDHAIRRIRQVKSAGEIAQMRLAATANQQAALAACATIRAGADERDLRRAFFAEAAARGNRGVFMVIDGASDETVGRSLQEGDALLVDCVSEQLGYHGDFARTIFIGEPSRTMRTTCEAIALGWSHVRERLRPGLRYSEITAMGREAVARAGFDAFIAFGPHSVGLAHTDEPGRRDATFWQKDDLVLEEGMILSVDCPVMQAGLGGTAHLEDLMLITAEGAEPIHPVTDPVILI